MATTDISIIKIRDLPNAATVIEDDELIVQQAAGTGKAKISKFIEDLDLVKTDVIGDTIGASMVGTSSGNTVQQVLDSQTSALLEFSQPDGAGKIGRCQSIADLRSIIPTKARQRIDVAGYYTGSIVGGGYFVYDSTDTSSPDDSGSVIVTTAGHRWKRVTDQLLPIHFGATPGKDFDSTSSLKNYITASNGGTIDLRGGPWRISSTLDMSSLRRVITDPSGKVWVNPVGFAAAHSIPYAVTFGNPDVSYGSGRVTAVTVEGIFVMEADNRDAVLHGLYVKGALLNFEHLRISGFNGAAFYGGAVWDSTFTSISCERSGNESTYQFGFYADGDTSNCLNIGRIQSEQAYHKCLYLSCIRSVIGPIHAERTYITTTDDGTSGILSGLKYINFYINVGNTTIQQVFHDCMTSGTTPEGQALAATIPSVVLNLDFSKVNACAAPTAYIVSSFGRYSDYDEVRAARWYFDASNFFDNNLRVPYISDTIYPCKGTKITGGLLSKIVPAFGANGLEFNNVDITSLAFSNNISGNITFTECRFPSTFTLGDCKTPTGSSPQIAASGDKSPVTFVDCEFLGTVAGSFQSRAIFRGGFINAVNLVSRAGFEFHGVKGNTFTHNGDRGYITVNCQFKTVSAWTVPSHIYYPIGTITQRLGSSVPANASAMYVVSAVDSTTSVSTWTGVALKTDIPITDKIFVESFGAVGDGVTDDTAAIQRAADSLVGNNTVLEFRAGARYVINSTQVTLPYVSGYVSGRRLTINGNGCSFITSGPYEPFMQWADASKSSKSEVKYGINANSFSVYGFANRDMAWTTAGKSVAWSYAYGTCINVGGDNLNKVIRAYGKSETRFAWGGSQIRDSLYSCYVDPRDGVTGFNTFLNGHVDWCSGDGLILKGPDVYVDGFTYVNVGCIQATNEDEIAKKLTGDGEPRGVAASVAADGVPASNVTILNVVGQFVGAGGFSLNASNVTVGGAISLGSHWTDNFTASLTGAMVWLNVTNAQIGNIKAKDIFSGIGMNAGCSDIQMGKFTARSKMANIGAVLISATDTSDRAIERVDIQGIYLHGQSTLNNDVYLNTAGITIGEIYIAQMNNQQGGYSVEFARACKVRKLQLVATTSAATNPVVRFSSDAQVDDMIIERVYGTAFLVRSGAIPKLRDIRLLNKQGTVAPIIIEGDGTATHNWGSLLITGPSPGRPTISGNLVLDSYTGNTWKLTTSGVNGTVSYPVPVVNTITEV